MASSPVTIDAATTSRPSIAFLIMLGGLAAIGPFAIDIYLPALPAMTADLHTSASGVQATLTASIAGMALGQLILGPLSDSYGRRTPLLICLTVYTITSVVCMVAPNLPVLIALRALQAIAAAGGIVIGRAAVRDIAAGPAMARILSMLLLVIGISPALAPIVGAELLPFTHWRGLFGVIACLGFVLLCACLRWLPETLPRERRRSGSIAGSLRQYRRLLTDLDFIGYAVTAGFTFAAMFAYISGSAFALEQGYQLSPRLFGVVLGVNALGMLLAGQISVRLTHHVQLRPLLTTATLIGLAGAMVSTLTVLADFGLPLLLIGLFLLISSVGAILPNSMALAMTRYPEVAGSAAALMGAGQFVIGGILAPVTGIGAHSHPGLAMTLTILICMTVATASVIVVTRATPHADRTAPSTAAAPIR
ncbi:multidrug effflux MFS transporter [Nocardia iowensis]|uniref:Multidrug effflux MFS transporter n=1 Tax=Nocardia iowensis TaxID=204891 RepID=A0ABX8RXV3_NOCIO|nr:multidrug effflux MFS transporter [Nocardia iowensis]QXN94378.1 multidrug effflux MFS transporter [Nocardia iowensis]